MSTPPPAEPTHQVNMSNRNAFKVGCMITLGVFAACFLAFCALPAACTVGMGSLVVGAASNAAKATSGTLSTIPETTETVEAPPLPTVTPSTVRMLNKQEATDLYKQAAASGLVVNYDRNTETIYVSDAPWQASDAAYVNQFVQAVNTLVGHGKPFRIIGHPSQSLIFSFNP